MNNRDKLWTAAYKIIEGLGPKFGIFKGTAESIAYNNIYNKDGRGLTDAEVDKVVGDLKVVMNVDNS
jgi:hypothetical protein